MGCDGGTIPKRDELVKQKKKPEPKDKVAELAFQWQCCAVTQEKLQKPIVTCGLGKLYSKCSLIEALLNKSQYPDLLKHIKSLKDVKDLNLTPNPEYNSTDNKKEGALDGRAVPYICPIIGLEMSGKFPFICLWACGCVMSERAIKEIKTKICPKCQQEFSKKDIIILNASGDDLEQMRINMEERQALMKANKKSKTKIKIEPESTVSTSTTESKPGPSTSTSKLNGIASGSSTNKLKRDFETSTTTTLMDPEIKKIKMGYSVAKDPKVTDVYKSLFTSHDSEKKQDRAHWVTYNPFYN